MGPSADGFETYGVTSVAMVTFIVLAVKEPVVQVNLLVWLFFLQAMMVVASFVSYQLDAVITRRRHDGADDMDFEEPLTTLVWITSAVSILVTYVTSFALLAGLGDGLWWKLATIMSCGTLAGALIPALVKVFTSVSSKHTRCSSPRRSCWHPPCSRSVWWQWDSSPWVRSPSPSTPTVR